MDNQFCWGNASLYSYGSKRRQWKHQKCRNFQPAKDVVSYSLKKQKYDVTVSLYSLNEKEQQKFFHHTYKFMMT